MKIFNELTVTNFAFLHGNVLTYSENKNDKEPLGVVFLEGHSVELGDERMFAISFHTSISSGRSYILQSETEAEAEVSPIFIFRNASFSLCTCNFDMASLPQLC